ncbi:hypothetical protein ACTJJ4_07915 [Microbacterium sp. 22195]|uniref:hypothetical protein n=1 Tax=Microbacterium sp. 22195 TaxID=3453891 RepID=UPI003F845BD6
MTRFDQARDAVAAARGDVTGFEAGARKRLVTDAAPVLFVPFTRPLSHSERFNLDTQQPRAGVTVRDQLGGVEYDVVLNERGRPTYFAVRAISGSLSQVDEWSREHVTLLVSQYLRREESGDIEADLLPRDAAQSAPKSLQPRREYIAELIREAHAAGVSPRQVVRAQTGNTTSSVDRWIADARRVYKDLPQATRPGRKSTTKGTEQ